MAALPRLVCLAPLRVLRGGEFPKVLGVLVGGAGKLLGLLGLSFDAAPGDYAAQGTALEGCPHDPVSPPLGPLGLSVLVGPPSAVSPSLLPAFVLLHDHLGQRDKPVQWY